MTAPTYLSDEQAARAAALEVASTVLGKPGAAFSEPALTLARWIATGETPERKKAKRERVVSRPSDYPF